MASPGGGYSGGSSSVQNSGSGSEGELQVEQQDMIMEQRKRKRMLSNRESARRSRMRKQQHLDSLIAEADQLKKENSQISTNIGITTQLCLNIESENSILRAQMAELTNSLNSLNDIISYINSSSYLVDHGHKADDDGINTHFNDCGFMDPWNNNSLPFNQPMMASSDMMMMMMY